jgi:uncharacterized protein YndB with AHSA1/START domain
MASIRTQTVIDAPPEQVWAALRDWGALHERLVPGFVTETRLDGNDRIVTFADGVVVREVLIDLDDDASRITWTIVDGPFTHHNGSAQVFSEDDGRARFVWITDLLPDELAAPTARRMEEGTRVVREKQERLVASA